NPLGGGALPKQTPSRPEIVKPLPPKPRTRAIVLGVAALAIIAGAALYLNRDRLRPENSGGPTAATFRTAVIASGELKRTLRLSGSIQAERFAALLAPQLHGNRGSMSGNRGSSRNSGSNASNVSAPNVSASSVSASSA